MWKQVKQWAVEQVLWAERHLQGKNGAEKKSAVIKRLDDLIVLPSSLEWVDDMILSWLVDRVCDKLNYFAGHDFGEIELTETQERDIADEIPDPEEDEMK